MTKLDDNTKETVQRLRLLAVANNHASVWCFEESEKESKSQTAQASVLLLNTVSFALNLFSVEQSLKILRLLYGFPFKATHDLHNLFTYIKNNVVDFEKSFKSALNNANKRLGEIDVNPVSKKEIEDTLIRNRKTYEDIRYLFVDREGNPKADWKIPSRDIQVVYCIASVFIEISAKRMSQIGVSDLQARKVPESEAKKIRPKLGIN